MLHKKEKRKVIRIKKHLVCLYKWGFNKNWDQTIVKDISEAGALITTMGSFCEDEIVTLRIKFPFRPFEWIEFKGRVVACQGLSGKYGEPVSGTHITRIEFVGLNVDQKELIRKYIAWFLTKDLRKKTMS